MKTKKIEGKLSLNKVVIAKLNVQINDKKDQGKQ